MIVAHKEEKSLKHLFVHRACQRHFRKRYRMYQLIIFVMERHFRSCVHISENWVVASVKFQSASGASNHLLFMGNCQIFLVLCLCPGYPGNDLLLPRALLCVGPQGCCCGQILKHGEECLITQQKGNYRTCQLRSFLVW